MDKLELTHTGGFPLRQDRLAFMQEASRIAIGHLGNGPKSLLSYDSSQQPVFVDGYVIYGCRINNNLNGTATVQAGAVFFQKEVWQVDEHTITLSVVANRWYYFAPELTDDPAGVKEYFDGNTHATQKFRKAKLSFTNYASGPAQLADLMNIITTYLYVPESSGSFDTITFMECMSPTPRTLARVNGWDDALGHTQVQRDLNGAVTVSVNLDLNGQSISSGVFTTLPVGYRPSSRQKLFVNTNNIGTRYYVGILENGTIQLEDIAGNPVAVNVTICFTHTFFITLT